MTITVKHQPVRKATCIILCRDTCSTSIDRCTYVHNVQLRTCFSCAFVGVFSCACFCWCVDGYILPPTPLAVVQKLVSWVCRILSLELPSQAPPAVNVRLIKAACKTVAVISKFGGSSVMTLLVNLQ